MRLPATAQSGADPNLLIVSVMNMAGVSQFIAITGMKAPGGTSGMTAEEESPSINEIVTSTGLPLDVGREPMMLKVLRATSDTTNTRVATRRIKNRRVVDLIVVASTETNLNLGNAVREAATALLQTRCTADQIIPATSAATGLTSSTQGMPTHEAETRARESTLQATVLVARPALRTGTGPTTKQKRRTFVTDGRTRLSQDDAERSLRKIRSEARLLLSKISGPEDESREHAPLRRRTTFQDLRPAAGLAVPSSATSLAGETSPEGPRLSAREKGKGRAGPSEPRRQSKSHYPAAEEDSEHREGDRMSTAGGPILGSLAHPAAPRRRTSAEAGGGEHQCDWKEKYDALRAEVDQAASGAAEAGDDHQCGWREKYAALKKPEDGEGQGQRDDIGLEGLTIVLHLRGRDDLVINTDLRELDAKG
ncbi:hypothetical protein KVR01_004187 [Diaporthe batatas]|uniref:uncharacterized protein n=1 Tax=Diaporthe batatas TaxID=748121 RepID=UPI001D05A177|nr:uncharacterized protein KVR01_004187 [Diaporthe batatas]KAG8165635.1 hypothetical protein KVR01_004187 [Diaporthe batatas]